MHSRITESQYWFWSGFNKANKVLICMAAYDMKILIIEPDSHSETISSLLHFFHILTKIQCKKLCNNPGREKPMEQRHKV